MFLTLPTNLSALRAAAAACGLDFLDGQKTFVYDRLESTDLPPDWPTWSQNDGQCDHVLRLEQRLADTCFRTPHEMAVFVKDDRTLLVWDDYKEGFGLQGLVGPQGHTFLQSFFVELTLAQMCDLAGDPPVRKAVNQDLSITLEYQVGQRSLTVRIAPDGSTSFKVEGCEGHECKTLTAAVEAALGSVAKDELTEDYYKEETQSESVHQG